MQGKGEETLKEMIRRVFEISSECQYAHIHIIYPEYLYTYSHGPRPESLHAVI